MTLTTFGQRLKDQRQKLDLTQQELGQRAGLSVAAIRKIESGERRPSKDVAEALAKALNVPPAELEAFVAAAREDKHAHIHTARASIPNNLPALLTPLIGRDDDLTALIKRMSNKEARLVTLIGPGGVGKTRLAIQVAEALLSHFADGGFFVDLAPITDPAGVPSAIMRAVGIADDALLAPLEALKKSLASKTLLLVLDNFEQVTRAAPKVAELLAACPGLKALVTSREITHIRVEQVHALAPLALAAAIALFVERAAHAKPSFTLTKDNESAITELCQRLDGLPLAIELVAARMKLMTPQGILTRIVTTQGRLRNDYVADGLSDLPARQHTLRHTIQWSYDLLNADEQRAFRQLGVFVGGCTLEAAEAVLEAPNPVAVWNALTSLLDKSLIQQREADGEARFVMLETIREFARDKMTMLGEVDAVQQRHARYFRAWSAETSPKLNDTSRVRWSDKFELDHNNIRAALQLFLDTHDTLGAADLGSTTQLYWSQRGYFNEGRQWLAQIWAQKPDLVLEPEQAVRWSVIAESLGWLADEQSDLETARQFNEHSLCLATIANNRHRIMVALNGLGNAYAGLEDFGKAQATYLDCLEIARELNMLDKIAAIYSNLGNVCFHLNDRQGAYDYFQQSLDIRRHSGDSIGLTTSLMNLAIAAGRVGRENEQDQLFAEALNLARANKLMVKVMRICINQTYSKLRRNDFEAALMLWREGMQLNRSIRSIKQDSKGVLLAATLSGHDKSYMPSARLFGAAKTHTADAGDHWDEDTEKWFHEWSAPVRAALGDITFEREYAHGQAMSLEEAVQFALSELAAATDDVA